MSATRALRLDFETPAEPRDVARVLATKVALTPLPGDFLDDFLDRRRRICEKLNQPVAESPIYRSAMRLVESHKPGLQFTTRLEEGEPILIQVCRVFLAFRRDSPLSTGEESQVREALSAFKGEVSAMEGSGLPVA